MASTTIQVQATQPGFYLVYRNPGDVFVITREGDFSHNWMHRLSPPPVTTEAAKPAEPQPAAVVPMSTVTVQVEEPKQKRKYTRKAKEGV